MTHQDTKRAINEFQVSELTGRAVQTLRNDRHRQRGIPYVKLGRSVRYIFSDVMEYLENHRIDPEAGNV
jgi:predicted DNA-binding transcriptional regulator AlpA